MSGFGSYVLKSVRIRPREIPVNQRQTSKTGVLDLKISVIKTGPRERTLSSYRLDEKGEGTTAQAPVEVANGPWPSIEFKGRRYEDLSDDDLIEDYIRTNTLRERPSEGEFVLVDGVYKEPFYQIVQDPFEKKPPASRNFGFDPYYLNNGSQVFIRWYASEKKKVQWEFSDITTTTQSSIGEVSIQITSNQYPDIPITYTYNSSNNPIQQGATPSYSSIESYWEYESTQIIQISQNDPLYGQVVYLPPGSDFFDENSLVVTGGLQYGVRNNSIPAPDGIVDDARDSATPSISIKPKGLVKTVEVLPPDETSPIWTISSISQFVPVYKKDLNETTKEYYFSDDSSEGEFDRGLDWMILNDLISAWNSKVFYLSDTIQICEPSYIPNKTIEYIDPINLQETPTEQSPTSSVIEDSGKIKLNILFPEGFEVKVREDSPNFKIFVGDIPTELLPGEGFQFQDDFEDGEGFDPEFTESAFSGPEEQQIVLLNAVEDSPTGPNPEDDIPVNVGSTTPGPGPVVGSKLTNKDGTQMINLAGHRLKLVLVDLQNYLNANGYSGSKIESNGIMRDLRSSAYPSSPARAAASLHGAGLAIDVKFNIPGKTWNSIGDNGNLSSDKRLTKTIMNWVKTQSDLTWGGQWGDGSNPGQGKVVGRGITEYHHFEIRSNEIPKYWEPVKDELSKLGFAPSELNKYGRGSRLHKLMLRLLGEQSA
jgi:hypothetical protein